MTAYMNSTPEIYDLINTYLGTVLITKPDEVMEFTNEYFYRMRLMKDIGELKDAIKGRPLVITGPFGVGKQTLIDMVIEKFGDVFCQVGRRFSPPHETEEETVFEKCGWREERRERAEEMVADPSSVLESVEVLGNLLLTSCDDLLKVSKFEGKVGVMVAHPSSLPSLHKSPLNPLIVLIAPPSQEDLVNRVASKLLFIDD